MLGHKKILDELKKLHQAGGLKHAYVFFGPEGVGKKTLAIKFATFLERGDEEAEGTLSDALLLETGEGGSFGIDEARKVKSFLFERPINSPKRTIILDGGETMTDQAANALLKIAEEPPESALIFLITRDLESMGQTLVSRFEKIYFGPVPAGEIEKWLIKKGIAEDRAKKAAGLSFGRPGLALNLLENENFRKLEKQVKDYMNARGPELKLMLKSMLEEEDFHLDKFLDMVILELAWSKRKDSNLWHKVLELRGMADNFSLNPKLQLENLHGSLT